MSLVYTSWAAFTHQEFRTETPLPEITTPQEQSTIPDRFIQIDISAYPAWRLDDLANQAYQNGLYEQAAQYQYWAIQNGDDAITTSPATTL